MCEDIWPLRCTRVKMYDLSYLVASKAWFRYMQLRSKLIINKEIYRMFAGDSQMLRNKRHFVISGFTVVMSRTNYMIVEQCLHTQHHSASLGRFVPHHASAVWRKAPLNRTIFRLFLEKKWLRQWSACLQVRRLTGVNFQRPKLFFFQNDFRK